MFQGTLQLYLYGGIVFYCVIFRGFVLSISYYYSNSLLLTFCPVLTEGDKHPMAYHNSGSQVFSCGIVSLKFTKEYAYFHYEEYVCIFTILFF